LVDEGRGARKKEKGGNNKKEHDAGKKEERTLPTTGGSTIKRGVGARGKSPTQIS